jgi:hypothetical protein
MPVFTGIYRNMSKVTIFKSLFDNSTSFPVPFEQVVDRIRNGKSKDIVHKIRNAQSKEERDELKKQSVVILFAGEFTHRNAKSLVQHSGLMVVDYDKCPESVWMDIIVIPSVVLAFRSPSGDGYKAVVKIPVSTSEEHSKRFEAFNSSYPSKYFDIKNKDVSRACFESYDPDLYYNPDAEVFTAIENDLHYEITQRPALVPITDNDKILDRLLKWWDKRFGFVEGARNSNLLILAQNCNEFGVDFDYAYAYVLNNVVHGFSESELENVFRSGYNRTQANTKYFEDNIKLTSIRSALSRQSVEQVAMQYNLPEGVMEQIDGENKIKPFWTNDRRIRIVPILFQQFLQSHGYFKYYVDGTNSILVRAQSNILEIVSVEQIKDFVLNYLRDVKEFEVWNHCAESAKVFTDQYLAMLDEINVELLKDTKTTAFVPFSNGVVKITKAKIELLSYVDIDGFIWKGQIVPREYYKSDTTTDFKDFVAKICDNDSSRVAGMESTLGYLIHSYKDKTHQKAIIFQDEAVDDNPNGGSGKSLIVNALKHFKKVVVIDGKQFDPNKGDFVYQRVNLDTQVLAFDDVKKNFNFESIFPLITEGITVNKKNKDEIFIGFDQSPKICITTNYVISGSGSSHERRRHELELHQYFNQSKTPLDEYGRLMFDQWKQKDWNYFDNYMIKNVQKFLSDGLIKVTTINAEVKRIIQATSKDFFDWAEDQQWSYDKRIYLKNIFQNFMEENEDKKITAVWFGRWINKYFEYKQKPFEKGRDSIGKFVKITTPF